MKRFVPALISVGFAGLLVVSAFLLLSRSSEGSFAFSPMPQDVTTRLAEVGITIEQSSSAAPKVSRERAVQVARRNAAAEIRSEPNATFGLATSEVSGAGSRFMLQEKPVWIVSFSNVTTVINKPANSPLSGEVKSTVDVLVDGDTGEFVQAVERSAAPVAEPEDADCSKGTC